MNFGQCLFLGSRQCVWQRGPDAFDNAAVALKRTPRKAPRTGAYECQRNLASKELVVGKSPPGRVFGRDVDRISRIVKPPKRLAECRKSLASHHFRVQPFG